MYLQSGWRSLGAMKFQDCSTVVGSANPEEPANPEHAGTRKMKAAEEFQALVFGQLIPYSSVCCLPRLCKSRTSG